MTVTDISTRVRTKRNTDIDVDATAIRVQQLTDMLSDPRYAGWKKELAAARAELVQLTAGILAA